MRNYNAVPGILLLSGLASTALLSACKPASDQAAATKTVANAASGASGAKPADTTAGMANMPGMSGMSGMSGMAGTAMMDNMAAHLRAMTAASGDSLKRMVPMHRQMVANMLSQANQEMQTMNMSADTKWTALTDSVRQDLIHLPDMSSADLQGVIAAQCARVTRLMEMHRIMMTNVKKQ